MLTVADYELIRRKHYVDGQSARTIAKEFGHSRKAVANALAHAVPPGYRQGVYRFVRNALAKTKDLAREVDFRLDAGYSGG